MSIPEGVRAFWAAFEVAAGPEVASRFYEAFHFCDDERSADELAALVLDGRKRATAALLWGFEHEGRRPPRPGDLSVVTDWAGTPLCVIETTHVEVVPFEDVGAAFAAEEGEGDGSLRHWREVHEAFFARECAGIGRQPDPRMPVVCERFRVVHPARTDDPSGR